MKPTYGQPPVVGFEVSIDEARIDYETYKFIHLASNSGVTMTDDQKKRYVDLKEIFEP